ncbi:MFS transporter [Singulisphaera sp. PoT]|uniref:MFS transporter n=1 Tax=Singulisphaera sp. PoT TaxID=3411797 RepID=UPI003BF560C0
MLDPSVDSRPKARFSSPWTVVGLLWFCGFFNYADRQAVNSVFPLLEQEFHISKGQQGLLGSAFMFVYALTGPIAGFVVDRFSRRILVISGLAFWSLICAATGLARSFRELIFYRAAEGLGESFYFPASMSLLADYHGPKTRSRAMSVHQTSVYVGTAFGGALAGVMGANWGWRSPFWLLGIIGFLYGAVLIKGIIEPPRSLNEEEPVEVEGKQPTTFLADCQEILRIPAAVMLLLVFSGANFVATSFLTWLTSFIFEKFKLGLSASSLTSMVFPMASLVGALIGGVLADRAARRKGGRMRVQGFSLIVGAPFLFATGMASSLPMLVISLVIVGMCKGVYDANIFASIYDVVSPRVRGTAAGLMNTIGWAGGSLSPVLLGFGADRYGLSAMIASTAAVYALAGVLAIVASVLAARKPPVQGDLAP